jgi:hypothetical protein
MEHHSAHRAEPVTVARPGHTGPREASGPMAWWNDGLTTYVLRFKGSHAIEHTVADEADTVIGAIEELRNGGEMKPEFLATALRDVRRLQTRLAAVADELLLYAREESPDGKPRLSYRAIGDETGQHFTTVAERHGRVSSGEFATWRHWLVQHTPREGAYPIDKRRRAAHLPKGSGVHHTEVYAAEISPGDVLSRCLAAGCSWETDPMRNSVTASLLGTLHEATPENLTGRTNINDHDAARPADSPLCRDRHPGGDTRCTRPNGHQGAPDNGPHTDPLGRTWPTR